MAQAAAVGWSRVGADRSLQLGRVGGQGLVSHGSLEPVAHLEGQAFQVLILQLFICPYTSFVSLMSDAVFPFFILRTRLKNIPIFFTSTSLLAALRHKNKSTISQWLCQDFKSHTFSGFIYSVVQSFLSYQHCSRQSFPLF